LSRSPSATVHSYTQEEGLETTKSGSTITYGPFHDVSSSLDGKFEQKTAHIHYNYEFPVLEIPTMKRAAEISHWGDNLNIQDEIFLHNAGPE
jgi:oligosaccharyltransferase complex subunit alpha (ribophorin I)